MAQSEEVAGTVPDKANDNDNNNINNMNNNDDDNSNRNSSSKSENDANVANKDKVVKKEKNIHVPKDKKLKIESVKVKEAISEYDIIYYDIHVNTSQNRWIVRKRFSEFEDLHNMLLKSKGSSSLPVLPPKHYKFLTDHTDPKFIEQRRALLDNYVRRLIKLKNVSTMQPVVNFFHDSRAIHITDDIIEKDANNSSNENNNNNDSNTNSKNKKNSDEPNDENGDKTNSEEDENNKNNNDDDDMKNECKDENSNGRKSSYDQHVERLITDSLPPTAKIVLKCEESYSFPLDQEITHLEIQSMRKMSDHVLYQILVKNVNREEPYDKWTVMKRFHNIYEMDTQVRQNLVDENCHDTLKTMPLMPEKKSKLIHDHMSDDFMEGRQVLLQNYFNQLLRIEDVAKNKGFLKFFGVDVGDD